jgi:16S rRNA processing protein RimM
MSDLVLLGYIARPFGIKGGVLVKLFNQHSQALTIGKSVFIRSKRSPEQKVTISEIVEGSRVFFSEIKSRDMADALSGSILFIEREDLPPLEDDEFYLCDLIGASAISTSGSALGNVIGFSDNNAQILFEIKTSTGDVVSIPYVQPIVQKVDCENKIITIDPPCGLLELLD